MRIVNRAEFLKLPADTLFAKYKPHYMEELQIKGDTWAHCNDFLCQSIADAIDARNSQEFEDLLYNAAETGKSMRMNFDCQGRDGGFDEDQLFAVYEPDDVRALIERLQRCVPKDAPPTP